MIKYHVMEERRIAHDALLHWAASTPFLQAAWQRFGAAHGESASAWCGRFIDELVQHGVLAREQGFVVDR